MVVARETSTPEEEKGVANEEEGLEVGVAFVEVDSTQGRFAASYASLFRIDSLLMAPLA